MTVPSSTSRVAYAGDGSTQVFPVPFYFLEETDLEVTLRTAAGDEVKQSLTADYTVSGTGDQEGGSITMLSAPANGSVLVIRRVVAIVQETDYVDNDDLPAETLERDFDRGVMVDQQLQEELNRTVKVSVTSPVVPTLPQPEAGRVIGWNDTEDGLVNKTIGAIDLDVILTDEQAGDVMVWDAGQSAIVNARPIAIDVGVYGAVGDGSTDDTAAFTALEGEHSGLTIDLLGKTYLVDAVPTGNRYRNGYFKVADYEADLDALVPARDTIDTALTCLAAGPYYAAWPQDKWHEWDGVIYALWMEGSQHSTSDTEKYVVCMRSKDGGKTWTQKEVVARDDGVGRSSFAAGVVDGVQFVVIRNDGNGGQALRARRLAKRYEMSGVIRTTAGSDKFRIYFADIDAPIGALDGMTGSFTGVGTVGGLAISGDYPVSAVTDEYIEFQASSAATSTAQGGGTSGETGDQFSLTFAETDWEDIFFGGVSLGAALAAAISGSTPHVHSFAPIPGEAGAFYIGLSGSTINVGIARIDRAFDVDGSNGGPAVTWARQIPGSTALSEPTVHYDGVRLAGFCRTQLEDVAPLWWWSDDELVTVTTSEAPGLGYATQSPIAIAEMDGVFYGFASGRRHGPGRPSPGTGRASVPLYLLRAEKAAALADGFSAFEWVVIDEAYFEDHYFAVSNSVGVGSLVALGGGVLLAGYSSEVPADDTLAASTSQVFALKIGVGAGVERGRSRIETGQVVTLTDGKWFYMGHPAVANGGYLAFETRGLDTAPAAYDTTTGYFTPPETGIYEFSLQVCYENGGAGTDGETYLQLVDEDDTDVLRSAGLFVALASNIGLPSNEMQGYGHFPAFLRQGQKVRFKVTATNGVRDSTARGYLYIKKVT
jgi:hypothetical protein